MKLEYEVIFAPKDVRPTDVQSTRCLNIISEERYDSRDKIAKVAKSEAFNRKEIDRYSIRKYWYPACCTVRLVDSPWNNMKDLANYLIDNYEIESITGVNRSWSRDVVECSFSTKQDLNQVRKKLKKEFDDTLLIASKRKRIQIFTKSRAKVIADSRRDAKKIFEKHEGKSNS